MGLTIHRFFVTCPRGLSGFLRAEIEALGGRGVGEEPGGCRVRGPLSFGYRMCLWSRCASRVLLVLADAVVEREDELYEAIRGYAWEDHLPADGSLAVDFVGEGGGIGHARYGAQRVKDAVVDRFRERTGERPSVDREDPDLRINVYGRGRGLSWAIDLGGESLHRRGYRLDTTEAPIKENLAAALLYQGGWPELAGRGAPFVDPMCGAGTLVLEAALMATDRAPGLSRARFGFERWRQHDAEAWAAVLQEAQDRAAQGLAVERAPLLGFDRDRRAIDAARRNAERAGVASRVRFEVASLGVVMAPEGGPGLVATNPPYGHRLGDKADARSVYAELGRLLRRRFVGWNAAVIANDDGLLAALGMALPSSTEVAQGAQEARLSAFAVAAAAPSDHPFGNRLRKNLKRLRKWIDRERVTCYRLYDADIPEYNAAVDVYEGRAHVQEYEPPAEVPSETALRRFTEITQQVPEVLGIPADRVFVKQRRRQKGKQQYERQSEEGQWIVAHEGGHRFHVNLTDYLDTGLFLDHRPIRAALGAEARGKRFLNLFAYTGTASVYAARGGARSTTSVDLSNTYLDWAARNFELNGIRGEEHRFVRADVLQWLVQERTSYDLVFLDPPTFSNSKAMRESFDVRRDHARMIDAAMARLAPGGLLVFSTNARRFRLHENLTAQYAVEDVTRSTIPPDFAGSAPHQCWYLRHRRPG